MVHHRFRYKAIHFRFSCGTKVSESGKNILKAISRMIYTKKDREMSEIEDGMDKSDVYDVGEETVQLARVCTIHVRGVNKCMHNAKLMQN